MDWIKKDKNGKKKIASILLILAAFFVVVFLVLKKQVIFSKLKNLLWKRMFKTIREKTKFQQDLKSGWLEYSNPLRFCVSIPE